MWFSEWLGAWEMARMWCWGPDRMKHMKSPSQSDNRKPEDLLVEGLRRMHVRGVDDDVAELLRNGLLLLELAVRPQFDIGRHLDEATVRIEEAQPVATARSAQLVRVAIDLDLPVDQSLGQEIHVGGRLGGEGDQVEPLLPVLTDPEDVVLRIGWRPEERHPAVLRDRDETPDVLVEVHGLSIAGDRNSDVAKMGNGPESQGHGKGSSRRDRTNRRQFII